MVIFYFQYFLSMFLIICARHSQWSRCSLLVIDYVGYSLWLIFSIFSYYLWPLLSMVVVLYVCSFICSLFSMIRILYTHHIPAANYRTKQSHNQRCRKHLKSRGSGHKRRKLSRLLNGRGRKSYYVLYCFA